MELVAFVSHLTANRWQVTVVHWGMGMKGARRHFFNTYVEAVEAAQNMNVKRIIRFGRDKGN